MSNEMTNEATNEVDSRKGRKVRSERVMRVTIIPLGRKLLRAECLLDALNTCCSAESPFLATRPMSPLARSTFARAHFSFPLRQTMEDTFSREKTLLTLPKTTTSKEEGTTMDPHEERSLARVREPSLTNEGTKPPKWRESERVPEATLLAFRLLDSDDDDHALLLRERSLRRLGRRRVRHHQGREERGGPTPQHARSCEEGGRRRRQTWALSIVRTATEPAGRPVDRRLLLPPRGQDWKPGGEREQLFMAKE